MESHLIENPMMEMTTRRRFAGSGTVDNSAPAWALILVVALACFGCAAGAMADQPDLPAVQSLVAREAQRIGVPAPLALAVAKVESEFDPDALGGEARGVMQVTPRTARTEFGIDDPDRLWDAPTNVRVGLLYLKRLYVRYGRRWDLALSHYNGGTLKRKRARAIPHSYTRRYVDAVLRWRRHYEREAETEVAMEPRIDESNRVLD